MLYNLKNKKLLFWGLTIIAIISFILVLFMILFFCFANNNEKQNNNNESVHKINAIKPIDYNPKKIKLNLTKQENNKQIINDYIVFGMFPKDKTNYIINGIKNNVRTEGINEYFYDENATLIKQQIYNFDQTLGNKYEFSYFDYDNRRVREKLCYSPHGIKEKRYTYDYNSNGQIIKAKEYTFGDRSDFQYDYFYNDHQELIYQQQYFPDGVLGIKSFYLYQS
ncbi:hypothetical protein [Candidatus Phytoplasma meliae]|uniref:DUF2963 domain-containing protein n=1 Tax=Candidatus Phytoplasma meliae TaxID=1848402 RepID=A0ABS5CZ46_9MOLU|nr:hypothetical protein [Candidatus Phytoplasma meliae]MBP5836142.1 hypothetical protein [Candidatus Phytoplasma meliae]MBP5836245.1 hypothetical protein [Candidatus Phytoplasma meliae]